MWKAMRNFHNTPKRQKVWQFSTPLLSFANSIPDEKHAFAGRISKKKWAKNSFALKFLRVVERPMKLKDTSGISSHAAK